MGMVRAHFGPNSQRVDEIILFHRLQKSEMGRIVEIQFARLQKLLEERKTLALDPARAIGWRQGLDAYGARPQRVIHAICRTASRNDPAGDADGDRVVIASEGNVLTFNGKARTAEIAQFELIPKRVERRW
jgi:ATP-dependent Clp protease ATP-binding subunit ClpB